MATPSFWYSSLTRKMLKKGINPLVENALGDVDYNKWKQSFRHIERELILPYCLNQSQTPLNPEHLKNAQAEMSKLFKNMELNNAVPVNKCICESKGSIKRFNITKTVAGKHQYQAVDDCEDTDVNIGCNCEAGRQFQNEWYNMLFKSQSMLKLARGSSTCVCEWPIEDISTTIYYSVIDGSCETQNCRTKMFTKKNCSDNFIPFWCYTGIKSPRKLVAGKGSQGTVFLGNWHGKKAAFKHIPLTILRQKHSNVKAGLVELEKTLDEYYTQSFLKHENVVKVHFCFRQQLNGVDETVVVMDACFGNLNQLPSTDKDQFLSLIMDVLNGLKYIAANDQCHGDIKPENILINKDQTGKWHALIADFGMVNKTGGTPIFMAPEGLQQRIVGKSDIYSVGMTMLLGMVETEFVMKLLYLPRRKGVKFERNIIFTNSTLRLIRDMISIDSEKRLSFDEIDAGITNLLPVYKGKLITAEEIVTGRNCHNDFQFDSTNSDDSQLHNNLVNREEILKKG